MGKYFTFALRCVCVCVFGVGYTSYAKIMRLKKNLAKVYVADKYQKH